MKLLSVSVFVVFALLSSSTTFSSDNDKSDCASYRYWKQRENILQREIDQSLGTKITLNVLEKQVNEILLGLKRKELHSSYLNTSLYSPAWIFTDVQKEIEKSELFQFIKVLPKGSSLHTHLTASVSFDYIFWNITHMDNLYICKDKAKMYFFREGQQNNVCKWSNLKDLRRKDPSIDNWIKNRMIIDTNTRKSYQNNIESWKKFLSLFSTYNGLVSYIPVYQKLIYQSLKEFYEDNVFYAEFRANIWPVYDLDNNYGPDKFFEIFIDTVNKFKEDHEDFLGAKFIFSPSRDMNDKDFDKSIELFLEMQKKYPKFIAGFDLVGFEDPGVPLKNRVEKLLPIKNKVNFVFHAGETNWNGYDVDENLVDAILLGTKRIGHGFALSKHPVLLNRVKKRNIGLEISPISNQVLWLVDDLRNHPGAVFASKGLPMVICNDDPGLWGAKGLSYDLYLAFMAFSRKDAGLEFLKQLVLNSIEQSLLSYDEKESALEVFRKKWLVFLRTVYVEKVMYVKMKNESYRL